MGVKRDFEFKCRFSEATATNVKLSQDQAESMQSPSVPAELGLCVGQEKKRRRPVVEQSDDAPDFPDSDPGKLLNFNSN